MLICCPARVGKGKGVWLASVKTVASQLCLESDVFTKAAALMHSLGLFLAQNGVQLTAANPELEALTLQVATSSLDSESIAAWLSANS